MILENPIQREGSPKHIEWNQLWPYLLILLPIILLLIGVILSKQKVPKKQLVDIYRVDKKTFNKWIKFFCADLIPNIQAYNKKRTMTLWQYLTIKARLGNPDAHPVLTKKKIIQQGEGTYYSLKGCIRKYPDAFGIPSEEAYLNLKKFPPNISRRISAKYG